MVACFHIHTKNHERYTKCPKCDKEILKESLETHECKYIKLDGEKIFKCKECDYSTKHHTNFKRHIDSRHRHVGILMDVGWGPRIFPGATMIWSLDPPKSQNAPVAFLDHCTTFA